jgi:outer membrane protein TolC
LKRLVTFAVTCLAGVALAEPPLPKAAALPTADLEAAYVATRRPMSLVDALKLAEQKSADLAAARASAQQVAAKARLVFSSVLPEITASVSYVHTTAEQKFDPSGFLDAFEGVIETSILGVQPVYQVPLQPNQEALTAVKSAFREAAADGFQPTTIVARNSLYGNLVGKSERARRRGQPRAAFP